MDQNRRGYSHPGTPRAGRARSNPREPVRCVRLSALDAFLSGVAYWAGGDKRLPEEDYVPWPEERLRSFLEGQCGLTVDNKLPGRFNTEHDGAFRYFCEIAEENKSVLHVTHVDGHADLGLGDPGWVYLLGEHMHKSLDERRRPRFERKGCNPGNYLAFLCAAEVVSGIDYVYPKGGGDDELAYIFKDNDTRTGIIELNAYTPQHLQSVLEKGRAPESAQAVMTHPTIPFKKVPISDFENEDGCFDHVFICQSPAFTPASADRLLHVINDYLILDAKSEALP